ncbi:hypothetical protein KIPB_016774, partial [Kipferlia bialata]|eukprot:g16774.t1
MEASVLEGDSDMSTRAAVTLKSTLRVSESLCSDSPPFRGSDLGPLTLSLCTSTGPVINGLVRRSKALIAVHGKIGTLRDEVKCSGNCPLSLAVDTSRQYSDGSALPLDMDWCSWPISGSEPRDSVILS